MYGYMMKYKGEYNLSTPYDLATKEFVRDRNGNFQTYHDISIDCKRYSGGMSKIYHYGKSILIGYLPCQPVFATNLIKQMQKKGVEIISIDVYDGEVDFKFNAKYLDIVAEVMEVRTSHKNRSPFSVKNLPREKMKSYKPVDTRYNEMEQMIKEYCSEDGKVVPYKYARLYKDFSKSIRLDLFNVSNKEKIKVIHVIDSRSLVTKMIKFINSLKT